MALFMNPDVYKLLYNKFVVIIGDSVHRGMYKDVIALLQEDQFLCRDDLKIKLSFMGDKLLEGGQKENMTNGINYREVREYRTDTHLIRFYFVTRAHNSYWREVILEDIVEDPQPDVIIMNSCLWDVSRYGSSGMVQYKENLEKTFQLLKKTVSKDCLMIWNTALPVANNIHGGFLLPELGDLKQILRLDVLEGNFYARQLAARYGIDVIDLNFHFRSLMHFQVKDGVHWNFRAHRRFTNVILAHIAKAWGLGLPHGKELKQTTTSKYDPSHHLSLPLMQTKPHAPLLFPMGKNLERTISYVPERYNTDSPPIQSQSHPNIFTSFVPSYGHQQLIGQSVSHASLFSNVNPYTMNRTVHQVHYNPYTQAHIQSSQAMPNPNPWNAHVMAQRRQRLLTERSHEVAGAMMGYGMLMGMVGSQYRSY